MKLLQISDLHLGKRLKEFSLFDDQKSILNQALQLMKSKEIDSLLLCGDIYDTTTPSSEATSLFDDFLSQLDEIGKPVFIISGNHDSADKLHFGSSIFRRRGIHIVTRLEDSLKPIVFNNVNFYLLPFIRPIDVNDFFDLKDNERKKTYQEAISYVIEKMNINTSETNIILSHQMVIPSSGQLSLGGSEDIPENQGYAIGGVEAINASVFQDFDFACLGHVHKPQNVSKNARYAGSIYKYHRDEANYVKSFTIVDVSGKTVSYLEKPISFIHDVIKVKGSLDEILAMDLNKNSFIFCILTDSYIDDPMAKLRAKYPLIAGLEFEKSIKAENSESEVINVQAYTKEELFDIFYQKQNGEQMTEFQKNLVHSLLHKEEK
ncbi:MAG: exonuclease SbcCD subunit D [Bacilli bacterium]